MKVFEVEFTPKEDAGLGFEEPVSIVVAAESDEGARALAAAAVASDLVGLELVDLQYCPRDVEEDCTVRVGVYENVEASGEPRLLESTLDD